MTRKVKVETSTTPSGEWTALVDDDGNFVLQRKGVKVLEMKSAEAVHVGALLVEAAAKAHSTRTKLTVGPNLRRAKSWSSYEINIPTDEAGQNTIGRGE